MSAEINTHDNISPKTLPNSPSAGTIVAGPATLEMRTWPFIANTKYAIDEFGFVLPIVVTRLALWFSRRRGEAMTAWARARG